MPIVLGTDLGTTTITTLALDADSGDVLACATAANRAEVTAPADRARGRREWDVRRIAEAGCDCLRAAADQLGERRREVAGVGITGQQHGVVVVGTGLAPLTPFVNWQDRRGDEIDPKTGETFVRRANALLGPDAARRAGCRLATGYLAVTLFWMKETGTLPAGTACFVMDYFGALLTGRAPVTDPTCAASGGVLDVGAGTWDAAMVKALGLPRALFPEVRRSGDLLGGLTAEAAARMGLPEGLPAFVGIGDNQASFLGSVSRREDMALVNVGTGGQVTAYTDTFCYDPSLETRPFPRGGFLLVAAGLCGGGSYAVLERFFRATGEHLFGVRPAEDLYPLMNRLAAAAPRGADGLRCEPYFTGSRAQPDLRASFTGASAENLTPGHLARALLEGMARSFVDGREAIARLGPPCRRLVGAGNGLRANPVLAQAAADELGLPLAFPRHREEAAFGAALLAAVGAGAYPDLAAAGRLVCLEQG
jgi:sugar (pentulose or hexulose) kinase